MELIVFKVWELRKQKQREDVEFKTLETIMRFVPDSYPLPVLTA